MTDTSVVTIKILLQEGAIFPKKATHDSACYDLYALRGGIIPPRSCSSVSTGVRLEMPANYMAIISGRSGLASKHGIFTHVGVVDSDFEQGLKVILSNLSSKPYEILPKDRIGQIYFKKLENYRLENALSFTDGSPETDSTRKIRDPHHGFGSTGR